MYCGREILVDTNLQVLKREYCNNWDISFLSLSDPAIYISLRRSVRVSLTEIIRVELFIALAMIGSVQQLKHCKQGSRSVNGMTKLPRAERTLSHQDSIVFYD